MKYAEAIELYTANTNQQDSRHLKTHSSALSSHEHVPAGTFAELRFGFVPFQSPNQNSKESGQAGFLHPQVQV